MPSPAYAPASSITPTTPIRPPPLSSSDSPSLPPLTPDSHTPTQVSSTQSPPTPNTPLSPAPSSFLTQSSRRKSTASISSRRKPVQANIGLEGDYEIALNEIRTHRRSLDTASMMDMAMTPTTASTDPFSDPGFTSSTPTATPSSAGPPRYVLEVAPLPPTYHYDLNGPYSFRPHTHPSAYIESGLSGPSAQSTREQLPIYAEDVQTEPDTLARKCWVWGFLFPVLWLIGMAILCIPLRPTEEEEDVDKAQKIEEMIVILRVVEIKYARRCAWSFGVFTVVLACAITVAVVVSRFK